MAITREHEQKAESAVSLMRFSIRLPSYRNEIDRHYQEKYHQFLTNPAAREIDLASKSNPVSYLYTTARKWVADKLHAHQWKMTWNPPEPTEYAEHVEHYEKTTVSLRRNCSSLDYIVLKKDEKNKIVDLVLNTDGATLRKHIRFGVFSPERFGAPSTQIIAALGRYFKSETQRILGGKLSTRYRAKNQLCEMIQDRIEKIQPLERLLNLHKLNPKHHREAIIAALKKYQEDLLRLQKKAVRGLTQAAVFEPNVVNQVRIKIQQDRAAAKKLQTQLRDAEQFSTSKGIDQALQDFIKGRFDDHIQEIEDRNRNCSYSPVDPLAVKGDLNNTIQDGFKITYTFTPDPNNPYTKEEQGIFDSKEQVSIRLFESLPHDNETVHIILARIGLVEGRYEVSFTTRPHNQVPAKESWRKKKIRLATASAPVEQACLIQKNEDGNVIGDSIPLEVAATTKHDWSDAGNPLTGLLRVGILGPVTGAIDFVTGVGKGLYQTTVGPVARDFSVRPYLLPSSKAEAGRWNSWLVPSNIAETSQVFKAFNPLTQPVDSNRPPQLDFGLEIYSVFANIVTSFVTKLAEGAYELGPHFGKAWHSLCGDFALAGMKCAGTPLTFEQLLTRIAEEAKAIQVEHDQLKGKVRERLQSEHPELAPTANSSGAVLQAHSTFRTLAPGPQLELADMQFMENAGDSKGEEKGWERQNEQFQEAVSILNNLAENRQLLDFRHKHSLHHNGLGEAVHQGFAGVVQFFSHNIIQKHPLIGGVPFITFGFLAALACYAPAQAVALGLSSGFINAMQTLGGWLANGDISEAVAASFLAAKGGSGFFELFVNGKESWLATLGKDLNKSPDKAWGYFATVVAFGKALTVQPIWGWLRDHLAADQGTIWPFADGFAGLKIALVMVHLVEHQHHFQPQKLERWKTILRGALVEYYYTLKSIPLAAELSAQQNVEIDNMLKSLWEIKDKSAFQEIVQAALQKSAQYDAANSDNSSSPRSVVAESLSLDGVLSSPAVSASTEPLQLQNATAAPSGSEQKHIDLEAGLSVDNKALEQSESKGQAEVGLAAVVERLQLLMLMIQNAEGLPYLSREAKYYLHYHLRRLFPKSLAEGLYELAEPPQERSIVTTFVSERLEYIPVFLRGLVGLGGFLGGICRHNVGSTEGVKKLYDLMESDLGSLIGMIEGCNNVVANDVIRHLGKFYAIPMDAIGRAKSSCGDTRFNNENAESPVYNGKVWRDTVKSVRDGARAIFGFFPGVDPKSRGHVSGRHAVVDAVEHIFTPAKP